jgi:hypothetical protein
MGFASFTVLVWDHIDTFTAEVSIMDPCTHATAAEFYMSR